MEINVLVDEEFEKQLDAAWLQGIAREVLSAEGANSQAEMGLVITSQEKVHELNKEYRDIDESTDVLSFYMPPDTGETEPSHFVTPPDGIVRLGEVIISYPQAVAQAQEHQHSVNKEIAILLIHGVLHLLGYDHEQPDEGRCMRAHETEIIERLGGL